MPNLLTAHKVNSILSPGSFPQDPEPLQEPGNTLSFFDRHPDSIVMLRAKVNEKEEVTDFTYSFLNHSAEKLLQRPKLDLIGNNLLDMFPGTKKEGIFDIYKKVFTTGKSTVLQFHYTHENFDASFRQRIEKFEKGILVHTVDITNHRGEEH